MVASPEEKLAAPGELAVRPPGLPAECGRAGDITLLLSMGLSQQST